jgi:hypothetical protein
MIRRHRAPLQHPRGAGLASIMCIPYIQNANIYTHNLQVLACLEQHPAKRRDFKGPVLTS